MAEKKGSKTAPIRIEKIVEPIRCKLTADEQHLRSMELARTLDDIERVVREKKAAASVFDVQIKAKNGHVSQLREALREGVIRDIECEIVYNYTESKVTRKRRDTGEILGERNMNDMDRQGHLPLSGEEKKKDDKKEGTEAAPEAAEATKK